MMCCFCLICCLDQMDMEGSVFFFCFCLDFFLYIQEGYGVLFLDLMNMELSDRPLGYLLHIQIDTVVWFFFFRSGLIRFVLHVQRGYGVFAWSFFWIRWIWSFCLIILLDQMDMEGCLIFLLHHKDVWIWSCFFLCFCISSERAGDSIWGFKKYSYFSLFLQMPP